MINPPTRPLRILHAVRAPVGGIIRHILDLAHGQADRGHEVGILADSLTGGERADKWLADIAPRLKLGVHRLAIRREPHPADVMALMRFARLVRQLRPDVLHGHGAKAGAFVRLTRACPDALRVYTPHGGSLHYSPDTLKGKFYARLEGALMNRTDLFLFESGFARDTYERFIGKPKCTVRCVFNGVSAVEFDPVVTNADATDFVYVGEFRHIKGADLLIDALARLHREGRKLSLTLCGDGEEMPKLQAQVQSLGLQNVIRFAGFNPARKGFAMGQVLVVPSRGDSMPYVVIEAAAAGIPMLASRVGGIPEIFGEYPTNLFSANDPVAMAQAMAHAHDDRQAMREQARLLKERVLMHFSQRAMVEGVVSAYGEARDLAATNLNRR